MTGPDNDPSRSLGGIVTVVNIILKNAMDDIQYFNRDLGTNGKMITLIKKLLLFRKVLKKPFNLIHFHFSLDKKSIIRESLFVLLARLQGIPIIAHFHGGNLLFDKKASSVVRRIIKASDKIIVLSEIEQTSLVNLYGTSPDKIIVLKNCVDFGEIPSLQQHSHDMKKLIFFGRIHKSKGIEDILQAFKQVKAPYSFDVYGTGPDADWFLNSMKEVSGEAFQYKGLVWGDKKWQALSESDIFLLPSRYGEGLPMALLEAMALGKVVITSDDASITKVVQDGYNGLLVKKKSPQDLAEKITRILSNPAERERLGHNAKKTIENEYSAQYYIKELHGIYEGTVKSN